MNLNDLIEFISVLLILIGTFIVFLSSVGIVRLPDVYTRSHAASKSATLGILSILIGTLLYFVSIEGYFSIKLFLGIFFVFLTAPVSAHLISRSAYRSNVKLAEQSIQDDVKEYLYQQEKKRESTTDSN